MELDPASLSKTQLLGLLRAYALTFIRLGTPDQVERDRLIAQFDPLLPSDDGDINTELVRLLVYLNAPTVIEKTLALITNRDEPEIPDWSELASRNARYGRTVQAVLDNHPPSREIGYALMLRNSARWLDAGSTSHLFRVSQRSGEELRRGEFSRILAQHS